jgi:pimeloyl-ACP methyl ester carboxylesterase
VRFPRLGALSPRRRWFVVLSLIVVLAGVCAAVAPSVVADLSDKPPSPSSSGYPAQDRLGPVLLVPGYGGDTGSLSLLAARVRATGRQATVVSLPDGGIGDIATQAGVLNGYVNDALRGAPSVDLVGYSAGGVVTLQWLAQYQGASKVRRVVTFGSPFQGTTLASAGAALDPAVCPAACQQLIPGSSLLTRLADKVPNTGHPPWLSLWTTQDQTVVPPESARLGGATNVPLQSVCPDDRSAHGDLPTDDLVIGLVLRDLGSAPPVTPSAADCSALRALSR